MQCDKLWLLQTGSWECLNEHSPNYPMNCLFSCIRLMHLEYCIQVWCPYLVRDIDKLENVQRRATKLVTELANLLYESRLREFGLYSLYC